MRTGERKFRDREFYRERVLAAHDCAKRWLFNAEQGAYSDHRSRKEVAKQLARELLEAIGAVKS